MTAKDRYPKLANFIGGYFHQNWIDLVAQRGEPQEYDYILNDLTRETRNYLVALRSDIERLISTGASELELRQIVREELNGNIDPVYDGSTWKAWLEHVNERITEHLKFSLR